METLSSFFAILSPLYRMCSQLCTAIMKMYSAVCHKRQPFRMIHDFKDVHTQRQLLSHRIICPEIRRSANFRPPFREPVPPHFLQLLPAPSQSAHLAALTGTVTLSAPFTAETGASMPHE